VRSRTLVWDGCCNIRDLGGHATEDGRMTRFGVVVRADNVRLLSDEGWEQLVAYGVRRIVDLRFEVELAEDPPRDVPIDIVHLPLLEDPARVEEIDELVKHVKEPAAWRRSVYLAFLDHFEANFATAVTAVSTAPEGAVLVHCAGGVDRTGLVAALLLRVAGVAIEAVAADYALSEANWASGADEWIEAADEDGERERRRLLSVMPAEAMRDVLVELERRHGSAWAYLAGAGVEDGDLERVQARLLG
jgi:protein-tyrosine phosphatase